jgi:hypothetical protein
MKKLYFYIAIFASAMFAACSSNAESLVEDLNEAIENEDKSEIFDLAKDLSLVNAQVEISQAAFARELSYASNKQIIDDAAISKLNDNVKKEATSFFASDIEDFVTLGKEYVELWTEAKQGDVDAIVELLETADKEYEKAKDKMLIIKNNVDEASAAKIDAVIKSVSEAKAL